MFGNKISCSVFIAWRCYIESCMKFTRLWKCQRLQTFIIRDVNSGNSSHITLLTAIIIHIFRTLDKNSVTFRILLQLYLSFSNTRRLECLVQRKKFWFHRLRLYTDDLIFFDSCIKDLDSTIEQNWCFEPSIPCCTHAPKWIIHSLSRTTVVEFPRLALPSNPVVNWQLDPLISFSGIRSINASAFLIALPLLVLEIYKSSTKRNKYG